MLTFILAVAALSLAGFLWGRVRKLEQQIRELTEGSDVPVALPNSPGYRQMMQIAHDVVREYSGSKD